MKLIVNTYLVLLLSSTSFFSHAEELIVSKKCKKQSKTKAQYSICLDEEMKSLERQLESWLHSKEIELEKLATDSQNKSVLKQFKKANAFYKQYIESQCRSVFFEKKKGGNPADRYRMCKITEIAKRIKQLESEEN